MENSENYKGKYKIKCPGCGCEEWISVELDKDEHATSVEITCNKCDARQVVSVNRRDVNKDDNYV